MSTGARPLRRLHLVLDADLGPALWVREQVGPGRSRALDDLTELLAACPPPLRDALDTGRCRLRHRVRIADSSGGSRRVPALPLPAAHLVAVTAAVWARCEERFGQEAVTTAASLLEQGRAMLLAEEIAAMPDLLAAALQDQRAEELVQSRHLSFDLEERADGAHLVWRSPDRNAAPMLHALVDARAREAFAPSAPETAHTPAADDAPPVEDPCGVLAALGPADEPLTADLPTRRDLLRTLHEWLATARQGVRLASHDAELVVRLHEPPLGTAWPLQTCLRERDGTVHPVADLRAVGDLSAAQAAEASGALLRLSATVREATVDDTGVDWLLTTAQASTFLTVDAPALEEAGITVMLPRQWTAQRTTLRAEAAPGQAEQEGKDPSERRPGVGLDAMARFRWRMAIGEVELTDEEMQDILEAQAELVQLRGQWVRLDAATRRAAERFLDAFAARTRATRQAQAEDPLATGRSVTGPSARQDTTTAPAPARATARTDALPEALEPLPLSTPATAVGELNWTDLFALLLSPEATDLDLGVGALSQLRGGGLLDLMPGGPGAEHLPDPSTLRATLRPYQVEGLNWMWALHRLGLGGILADDMGLGKTMQVLALLCREREEAAGSVGPTLLVCPMSVVGAWQREARTFAPHLRVHVHHGGDRLRDESFTAGAQDLDLVLTTYSLLARDQRILSGVDWHRIVFDEAQHVKNPGTQVTRAARALPARHRLALTGTPVENRLDDLHSLMEAVNPGLLGSAESFRERIASPIETSGDPGALSRLRFVTAPFVLRRVKTDRSIIRDLPEKIELTRIVSLTPEQAGLYQALVDDLMIQLDGADQKQRRTLVVSTLTKLKQVCNHPAHYLGDGTALLREGSHRSGKLEMFEDLLEGAFEAGSSVLAFTQFTTFGHMIVPYLQDRFGITVPFLHGGVAKKDRDQMVADFQDSTTPGLMLLSLRAGGTGLTLTAANHVVHLDRWWNPAVENQATDRAYRIGQRRDVTVHRLVCAGTVEERIDEVLARKQGLADLTIAPGEQWVADLDDAALRSLLTLDEEG